jgi:hypothetical protein
MSFKKYNLSTDETERTLQKGSFIELFNGEFL